MLLETRSLNQNPSLRLKSSDALQAEPVEIERSLQDAPVVELSPQESAAIHALHMTDPNDDPKEFQIEYAALAHAVEAEARKAAASRSLQLAKPAAASTNYIELTPAESATIKALGLTDPNVDPARFLSEFAMVAADAAQVIPKARALQSVAVSISPREQAALDRFGLPDPNDDPQRFLAEVAALATAGDILPVAKPLLSRDTGAVAGPARSLGATVEPVIDLTPAELATIGALQLPDPNQEPRRFLSQFATVAADAAEMIPRARTLQQLNVALSPRDQAALARFGLPNPNEEPRRFLKEFAAFASQIAEAVPAA